MSLAGKDDNTSLTTVLAGLAILAAYLADLKALLEQIPEDTMFRAQRQVGVGPGQRTQ